MKTFIASRVSTGNRVFPAEISMNDQGITLVLPWLFSSKEKTIPYTKISSVKVECPIVGYSTIIIETTGEGNITAHGFTSAEVREMKKIILDKI